MGIPVALYYSDFRRYERRGSWKPKMLWVCYFLRPNIQSVFTKKSSIVVHIQSKWKSNKNGMSPLCRWGYIGAVLSHSTLRSRLKSSPDSSPLLWLTYYRTSQLFESPSFESALDQIWLEFLELTRYFGQTPLSQTLQLRLKIVVLWDRLSTSNKKCCSAYQIVIIKINRWLQVIIW